MKIALLHLDVAEGPETRNRRSIISAAGEAVSRGADWIVTPETALQGYFFYDNNGKLPSFSEKQLSRYLFFAGRNKADMVLVTAAWPPGKCCSDPVSVWETCSKLCGVPVIVCNQTGYHERMDMREAESAVIVEGQRLFTYKGDPAVLFCEWDEEKMRIRSRAFEVVHVK